MKVAVVLLARLLVEASLHPDVTADPRYGKGPKKTGKPLMDAITAIRTEMCWQRPNLMEHEKCLKFLGIHCCEESTGQGICKQFEKEVTEACLKDPSEKALAQESEESLRLQKLQCAIADDLGDKEHHDEHDHSGGDSDSDGVPDIEDAFPLDPHETKDFDGDGIGDNADPDTDNDGIPNEEDEDPYNVLVGRAANHPPGNVPLPRLVGPSPAPAPGAAVTGPDADSDGVPDADDAFPQDPNESSDRDGDGVGDNSDAFPDDSTEWLDSDGDGVGDNKDAFPQDPNESMDSDGDGYGDKSDHYPNDSTEWADSDGDGVGDNADHYPFDPNCHTDPCVLEDGSLAPAAAFVPAPGPSPAHLLQPKLRGGIAPGRTGHSRLQPGVAPWTLNKLERGLPEQGFNEHSRGVIADHEDGKTFNGDWGNEFHWRGDAGDIKRICDEFPDNDWCRHRRGNYAAWKWPFAGN